VLARCPSSVLVCVLGGGGAAMRQGHQYAYATVYRNTESHGLLVQSHWRMPNTGVGVQGPPIAVDERGLARSLYSLVVAAFGAFNNTFDQARCPRYDSKTYSRFVRTHDAAFAERLESGDVRVGAETRVRGGHVGTGKWRVIPAVLLKERLSQTILSALNAVARSERPARSGSRSHHGADPK
jgi:hypothetical protein